MSNEERGKRESRKKMIIGIVLVSIMVFGTAGYAFFSNPSEGGKRETVEYNGIKFILNDAGFWEFNLQFGSFVTRYNPKETENISVPVLSTINSYSGRPLYFAGQSESEIEIVRGLQGFISKLQYNVCIENYECEDEIAPIKNCSRDNVILFKESNFTEIKEDDGCIFISAPYNEQVRAADAFLFKILGIRKLYF